MKKETKICMLAIGAAVILSLVYLILDYKTRQSEEVSADDFIKNFRKIDRDENAKYVSVDITRVLAGVVGREVKQNPELFSGHLQNIIDIAARAELKFSEKVENYASQKTREELLNLRKESNVARLITLEQQKVDLDKKGLKVVYYKPLSECIEQIKSRERNGGQPTTIEQLKRLNRETERQLGIRKYSYESEITQIALFLIDLEKLELDDKQRPKYLQIIESLIAIVEGAVRNSPDNFSDYIFSAAEIASKANPGLSVQVENFANEMVKKEIERLRQDSSEERLLGMEDEIKKLENIDEINRNKQMPSPQWARGMPQANPKVDGWETIIDRYFVILRRGQTSEILAYSAPRWLPGEKDKFKRHVKCHSLAESTLIIHVNGQRLICPFGQDPVMFDQIINGRDIILSVELGEDAELGYVPVEFVYYRDRR